MRHQNREWPGPGRRHEPEFGEEQHEGPHGHGPRGHHGPPPGGLGGPGGFGRNFGRSRGKGRGGRANRGDVRLAVLAVIANEPMHGYQIMNAINERTGGAWQPSPGAIYPTIAALEDEGLVTVTADSGRKLVSLTDTGREFVTSFLAANDDPFAALKQDEGAEHQLRHSLMQLMEAARAVTHGGSEKQIEAALKVTNDAKRALYLILAGDES